MTPKKEIKKKLWYTFLAGGTGIIHTDDKEEHRIYASTMDFIVFDENDVITAKKCDGKKFSYKLKHIVDAHPMT
jgi:hypothetical protein